MPSAISMVKAGKVRVIGVATKKRVPSLPDVPTMAEAGFPEVEGTTWTGLFVPAGTPKDVVVQLNRMIALALAQPDVKERLAALGVEPVSSSPEACDAFVLAEMAKWSKVIRAAGLKAE